MASRIAKLCFNCVKQTHQLRLVRPLSSSQALRKEDIEIHTGQKWDEEDVRMVRFVDREKVVNKQYAIDLIAEVPPIACGKRVVSCDGGGGALGHPKVYINLDQPGNHACGYCGLRFFKDDHH